ncbi:hypothetical protein K502DRAFT_323472 [Neoconidiobolus thromboides FSU 785]|nr:hypothetical protein K502DRAFT_323472 [Neoconidiobolus thromboides FSU 785]
MTIIELDALGDELTFEESEGIPSYLQENDDKMPEFLDELNQLETELVSSINPYLIGTLYLSIFLLSSLI